MHPRILLIALPLALAPMAAQPEEDMRELVAMPPPAVDLLREEMRNHTIALTLVFGRMVQDNLKEAGELAERHLGLSAQKRSDLPGSPLRLMSPEMRSISAAMYRAGSRLADAAATGNRRSAETAMLEVTVQCAACHASYRVR